jgi:uncharacterized membrane protein
VGLSGTEGTTEAMNMPKELFLGIAIFAAVGCGLIGGLLFAFSNFVMKALSQQPPENGIRAMQAINVFILNPLFLIVFLGTALASVFLVVAAVLQRSHLLTPWLLGGCVLYLVGTFGITILFNVPLNDKLASLDPFTADAAQFWPVYLSTWLKWNHVRTVASLAAATLFILAIRHAPSPSG